MIQGQSQSLSLCIFDSGPLSIFGTKTSELRSGICIVILLSITAANRKNKHPHWKRKVLEPYSSLLMMTY
jgi:hypothetical protein